MLSKILKNTNQYIFKSERLGFRNWNLADIEKLHEINSDKDVMAFFPSIPTKEQTTEFVSRMIKQFETKGYCYFAVDTLNENKFIGFIGLSEQIFEADFTPCVDIGWRIKKEFWNKGFATEGAKKCLVYAKEILKLQHVYAIAPKINVKSEKVMINIGMKKQTEFEHPMLFTMIFLEHVSYIKLININFPLLSESLK